MSDESTEIITEAIADQSVDDVVPKKTRKKAVKSQGQNEDKKTVRIDADDVTILDYLRGSLSRSEYLHNLLMEEKTRQVNPVPIQPELSTSPQKWFTTSKNDARAEVKDALGIESDEIVMSETDLISEASRLSGVSTEEIQKQGRQTYAQKLITQFCKPRQGIGQAGSADLRLDKALEEVREMVENGSYQSRDGKISLTAVANRAMANFNSAKAWAERRGHKELFGLK